jgi:hypothetical protein
MGSLIAPNRLHSSRRPLPHLRAFTDNSNRRPLSHLKAFTDVHRRTRFLNRAQLLRSRPWFLLHRCRALLSLGLATPIFSFLSFDLFFSCLCWFAKGAFCRLNFEERPSHRPSFDQRELRSCASRCVCCTTYKKIRAASLCRLDRTLWRFL